MTQHHSKSAAIALERMRIEDGAERVQSFERAQELPGIRLEREPDIRWSDLLMSYELRDAVVTCARSEVPPGPSR